MQIQSPKFYRFGYYVTGRSDSPLQIHHLRDGATFLEISSILQKEGYTYGSTIFNWPFAATDNAGKYVDTTFLKSKDLIVLTTRPPIHDKETQPRMQVELSDTILERLIFNSLENFLEVCDREHVKIAEMWADRLNSNFCHRADILYKQYGAEILDSKTYKDLRILRRKDPQNKTIFYIINIPQLWNDGPGLFCFFGMHGLEAYLGAYLLRTRFWQSLNFSFDKPRMTMLEITLSDVPEFPDTLYYLLGGSNIGYLAAKMKSMLGFPVKWLKKEV